MPVSDPSYSLSIPLFSYYLKRNENSTYFKKLFLGFNDYKTLKRLPGTWYKQLLTTWKLYI